MTQDGDEYLILERINFINRSEHRIGLNAAAEMELVTDAIEREHNRGAGIQFWGRSCDVAQGSHAASKRRNA